MLSIQNVVQYWGTVPALAAVIPANSVWLDVAADGQAMPYAVLTVLDQKPTWSTANPAISHLRFRVTIYASTLTSASNIVGAVQGAFDWQNVTSAGYGCVLQNYYPRGEVAGAYSATLEYLLGENLTL